jgi:hypothetical protein
LCCFRKQLETLFWLAFCRKKKLKEEPLGGLATQASEGAAYDEREPQFVVLLLHPFILPFILLIPAASCSNPRLRKDEG